MPVYRYYSPLGSAGILQLCTAFTQDDDVFGVVGTFVDFSGDAQTCIAKQEKRVLMTFNLTQAIMDKSPAGLIVTPGSVPEGSASILIKLIQKQGTLDGKTVAVLGDSTESAVVNGTIVPELKKAGIDLGTTAVLDVGTSGDFTAAQAQLTSFMEKWKTEGVDAVFLSGDLASTKAFTVPIKKNFPDMLFLADNTDVLSQAQQLQQAGVKPNPYEGVITAGGLTPTEYVASDNWKYCSDIYKAATGKEAPNSLHTIKTADGKIDDTSGAHQRCLSGRHDVCRHRQAGRPVSQRQQLGEHGQHVRAHREPGLGALLVAPHREVRGRRQLAPAGLRLVARQHGTVEACHAAAEHPERLEPSGCSWVAGLRPLRPGLPRQPEASLGDEIAHDLVGSAGDGPRSGVEERVLPPAVVDGASSSTSAPCGPWSISAYSLSSRFSSLNQILVVGASDGCGRAERRPGRDRIPEVALDARARDERADLLAHRGVVDRRLRRSGGTSRARRTSREIAPPLPPAADTAAFLREAGTGDPPAFAGCADHVRGRYRDVFEEHLVEVRRPGDLAQRPGRDARAAHVEDERGDSGRSRDRLGAGQQVPEVGVLGPGAPHLLPVDDVLVAFRSARVFSDGEVAARVGLAEQLGPDVVAARESREIRLLLLVGPELRERAADERVAEHGRDTASAELLGQHPAGRTGR